MLQIAALLQAHDVDHFDRDAPIRRGHAKQLAAVGGVNGLAGGDPVALGQLIVDLYCEAALIKPGLVSLRCDFGEPEPTDLYLVYPTRRLLPRRVRLAID